MPSARQHWLIKSEPSVYPYHQLVREGRTAWTGVRNFEARNNLKAMEPGDLCLYYHSNEGKAVVGVARALTRAVPDPTASGEEGQGWVAVDVAPVAELRTPVTLQAIKASRELAGIQLVTRSRLSVVPVSRAHFDRILEMAQTQLRRADVKQP